jgi:hypothetical protein
MLTEARERISKFEEGIADINQIPVSGLLEMIEELNRIQEYIQLAEYRAREAIISSHLRSEMANSVVAALSDRGWQCEGAVYEGEEQTNPIHVKLRDSAENEIVVVITPHAETLCNNLEINFFDPYNNDLRSRERYVQSIYESLSENTIGDVSAPVCREGYEVAASDNEALRNIEATAQKKPQQVPVA